MVAITRCVEEHNNINYRKYQNNKIRWHTKDAITTSIGSMSLAWVTGARSFHIAKSIVSSQNVPFHFETTLKHLYIVTLRPGIQTTYFTSNQNQYCPSRATAQKGIFVLQSDTLQPCDTVTYPTPINHVWRRKARFHKPAKHCYLCSAVDTFRFCRHGQYYNNEPSKNELIRWGKSREEGRYLAWWDACHEMESRVGHFLKIGQEIRLIWCSSEL